MVTCFECAVIRNKCVQTLRDLSSGGFLWGKYIWLGVSPKKSFVTLLCFGSSDEIKYVNVFRHYYFPFTPYTKSVQ